MPLIRIDLVDKRTADQIRAITDAVHAAVVDVLNIPARDRFQIVTTHRPGELVAQDAGLGFERTENVVIVQVFTQAGRTVETKQRLYAGIAHRLAAVGVAGEDVVIGLVENHPQDWSFGFGAAQYVTGALAVPAAGTVAP